MARGISIHIGVNRPAALLPLLTRSEDAAWRMAGLALQAGYQAIHVLRGADEITGAEIRYQKLFNDRRSAYGPFDIVGDVHGCRAELELLLGKLGWALVRDEAGRPVDAAHPEGRTAVFVGDLVDRGPDSPGVLRLVMGMVEAGHAFAVCGNHEQKLVRALRGRNVQVKHGLAESLAQLAAEPEEFRERAVRFCDGLIAHYVLDGGDLVCIFPEGGLTRDGQLGEFKGGVMKLLESNPVPVIPLALQNLWGSFFSRAGGAAMSKPFRRGLFSRVGLVAGDAVDAAAVTPAALRERVGVLLAS